MKNLNTRKRLIVIVILIVMGLLPFINKAYHIDDTLVLYTVKQIIKSPLHPFSFNVNWYGLPQSMWELTNPPFIFYYFGPIAFFFGEKEIWFHIHCYIFAIITGISMYFLGKRFTKYSFLSTLLLVSTPAFLVSATSIMPDIPFLSLYLSAIIVYIHGTDRDNRYLLAFAGILIGLACLTKYTGLTLIPLLLFYSLFMKKRLLHSSISFGIGFTLFGIWGLYSKVSYGHLQFIEVCKYFNFGRDALFDKTLGTLSYIGGGTIFSLLFFLICKKGKDILVYFLTVFFVILLSIKTLLKFQYTIFQIMLVFFYASLGLFFCIKIIHQKILREKDEIFLLLWFFGILIFNIIIEFAAVRYVLILVPPMILLLIRRIEETPNIKKVLSIGISLTFFLGLLTSYGDYKYANCYRDFPFRKATDLKNKKSVWFSAHWGFQYYMEKEGYRCFSPKVDKPRVGDILVIPYIASYDMPIDVSSKEQLENYLGRHLKLIETVEYNSWFPVRTIHGEAHAGFYSHGWGFLPFAFSRMYLERFYVWEFI